MLHGSERLLADGLAAFAAENGWSHAATAQPPALGQNLWEQVSNGVVMDRISGDGWEAGHLTGGQRSAQTVEQRGGWTITKSVTVDTPRRSIDIGYLAITLPRMLPNMVLDATSNDNGPFSSLINKPAASQHLSLEGNFDQHFRLFVPKGYETDALYVFTPDLMALLIDESGDLDVEIRENQLIIYKPGGFDLHEAATWERFAALRRVVGTKAWERTALYTDDRVPPVLELAESGRRLRRRTPKTLWMMIAIPVIVVVFIGGIATVVLSQLMR